MKAVRDEGWWRRRCETTGGRSWRRLPEATRSGASARSLVSYITSDSTIGARRWSHAKRVRPRQSYARQDHLATVPTIARGETLATGGLRCSATFAGPDRQVERVSLPEQHL